MHPHLGLGVLALTASVQAATIQNFAGNGRRASPVTEVLPPRGDGTVFIGDTESQRVGAIRSGK